MTLLEQLAQFAFDLEYEAIPLRDREHMKYDFLDSLGCGIYGSTTPWSKMVARFAQAWGGDEHSSVWGTSSRCTCANATLANGTSAQALEMDNSHTPLGLHLGCSVVPAAVAVAEKEHASGLQLLEALTAGYEISIRIRGAMDISHILRGFNSTGTCGGFGAAAAVGKLLGLSVSELVNAMGIVGVHAMGIQAAQFSMAKRLMGPRSAEGGLAAAFLAAEGFTGTRDLLEADLGGFFKSLSDRYDTTKLTDGLGAELRIEGMGIKPYPSSHGTHAALDAARSLRQVEGFDTAQIRKIHVKLPPHAAASKTGWVVTDIPSALHDVRFTLAVMLHTGDFSVEHLAEEMLHDPVIRDLMAKVEIAGEPEFGDSLETRWTGQVILELEGGRVLESDVIWHPKGTPANPMSTDEIAGKFLKLAVPVLSQKQSDLIVEVVAALEKVKDINELTWWLSPRST